MCEISLRLASQFKKKWVIWVYHRLQKTIGEISSIYLTFYNSVPSLSQLWTLLNWKARQKRAQNYKMSLTLHFEY